MKSDLTGNLRKALNLISEEMMEVMKIVFESSVGINDKTGENTLKDSDLIKSMVPFSSSVNDGIIGFLIDDYIEYIESGRKPGKYVPLQPLIKWMKKNGISTDNKTIHSINYSIMKNGISPRKVGDSFYDMINKKYWNDWADIIFNEFTKHFEKYHFND